MVACLLLAASPAVAQPSSAHWAEWPEVRFVRTPAACLRHAELIGRLRALETMHPGRVTLEVAGRSAEDRAIHVLSVGRGPMKVLLWSQMHGDEPSATPALLDLVDSLLRRDPEQVLERLTLLVVPMLNPDGTERYQRRNAQGIDVNRDALNLATPEGRILKAIRDAHQPQLGFNLHDQDRRTIVGEGGALASISLLAVSGDPQGTVTEGRLRAKRVCSAIVTALAPFVGAGSIGRYDEDWSPRAFGDNLTAWGTPVVLIESGGLPPSVPLTALTRANYVALHAALEAIARDDAASHDPAVYEALPRNQSDVFADVVVRGGLLLQATTALPYRADIAFDQARPDAAGFGCPVGTVAGEGEERSRIEEVGDARFIAAGRSIDAAGRLVTPALVVSVEGAAARRWLTASTLRSLARLGVGRLLWHVAPAQAEQARAAHARVVGSGQPAVEIVAPSAPKALLLARRAPTAPASRAVKDVLTAIMPGWRRAAGGADGASLLRAVTAVTGAPLPLSTGEPATFLILSGGAGDPLLHTIESVVLDGTTE